MMRFAPVIGCLLLLFDIAAVCSQPKGLKGLKSIVDLSTDIVIADVLDTNPRTAIEGARDTVQLSVVRTLKGPLEPGQQIGVYYHLLWIDRKNWVLEKPKFNKGSRYTVFLRDGYRLTDPWLAVLPDHPDLAIDVIACRNEVGDLWSDESRRKQKDAIVSRLKIDLIPDTTVSRTKDGLILSVKIVNQSSKEITTRLVHETQLGDWLPTDLYASVTPVRSKKPALFEPVYFKGDQQEDFDSTVAPGKSVTVELRMDWPGTESMRRSPFMTIYQKGYKVRLLMVFDAGRKAREYAASTAARVGIAKEWTYVD